jgi:hypothetical protein
MSEPTTGPGESAEGSLIENVGTPPELPDAPEITADDVAAQLFGEDMTEFYEADESGFRVVDDPTDIEGEAPTTEAAEDEPAVEAPEEEQDTAEAAPAEEEVETLDGEDAEDVDASELEPFTFKADGTEFTLDGVRLNEDGDIVISSEDWSRQVQPHLADRRVWQAKEQEFKKAIADLDPAINPVVKQAEVMLTKVNELLTDADALDAFVEDFEKNRDRLIADAEKARLQQELDNLKAAKSGEQQAQQTADLGSQIATGIEQLVEMAVAEEAYAGLDTGYLSGLLTDMKASIFYPAPEDVPEAGISQGDIVVDYDVVARVVEREAKRVQAAEERTKARRKNSATRSKRKAPATPATKPVAAPAETRPQSKEEWLKRIAQLGG